MKIKLIPTHADWQYRSGMMKIYHYRKILTKQTMRELRHLKEVYIDIAKSMTYRLLEEKSKNV